MRKCHCIEPVVAIYSFANFMAYPLLQQFVYQRLREERSNSSLPASVNSSHCTVQNNSSSTEQEIQRAASMFFTYLDLISLIPSLIVTLTLVTYSDQRGRKIIILLPLIGSLLSFLAYFLVSFFTLNLYIFFVSSFLSSLFGGLGTFLGGCFSYVIDLCNNKNHKAVRIALIDMLIGLFSGGASLATGYFLKAAGFSWPFLVTVLFQCLNIIYVSLLLEETIQPSLNIETTKKEFITKLFNRIYLLFANSTCKRNTVLLLLLLSFSIYNFANLGGLSLFILYELNSPLCWDEILIGYGSAISTLVFLTSFIGVCLFSRCLQDIQLVYTGLLSVIAGFSMAAFTKTTLMMFLVRLPLLLALVPAPVLRSMMSGCVSSSEQGALFACIAVLENITTTVAVATFNSIYAATVSWFPGFVFLLAAGLCLIPMCLMR
ncbi:S46A3 protein, partial [Polypterus senegalus]|nr:S46A3 protein [Polypterus senegalus]